MEMQFQDEVYVKLLRDFDIYGMALYIGQGIDPEELTESFCRLPWGCVITSYRNLEVDKVFKIAGKLNVTRCIDCDGIIGRVFQPQKFYVAHLYADEDSSSEVNDYVEVEDLDTVKFLQNKKATKLFEFMLNRIRAEHGKMIVIGYAGNNDDEFPVTEFHARLVQEHDDVVFFQSIDEIGNLKGWAERQQVWHESSLLEAVEKHEEDDEEEERAYTVWDEKQIFFKAQNPVAIEKSFLERSDYFLQLLTEQVVRKFIPYGRSLQELWFFNFLHNSSKEPQWYGYLPQTEFYLKRNFEDTLAALVRNLLFNRGPGKGRKDTPVILQGAPGSSKSIELCALAYRIFNEEVNPVIYIKNDALTFSSGSDEFELLDELMMEIERKGETDMRILILWDSASYRNVTKEADNLALELSNRGRRFVLVCTAYEKSSGKSNCSNGKKKWYRYVKDGSFKEISEQEAENGSSVVFDEKYYFISATRTMEQKEKVKLKEKVRRFILRDRDIFERKWNSIERDIRNSGWEEDSSNDIFYCFYSLIRTLQPQLDRGLTREQEYVSRYVRKQLDVILGRKPLAQPMDSDMVMALREAGIVLTGEDIVSLNGSEKELEEKYDLDKFNICIALFSRFKLKAPYGLAYYMFRRDKKIDGVVYDSSNRELMDILMNDFSYIVYSKEEQCYFFRNSLEAVLFLRNNNISEEAQIDIVCEMLDYYAQIWKHDGFIDPVLDSELPKLLRMMGPNTDYGPFQQDGSQSDVHMRLLKHLEKIIQKLEYMRTEMMVPDKDGKLANIEITFTREFYGRNWNWIHNCPSIMEDCWEKYPTIFSKQSYRTRLSKLKRAVSLAKDMVKNIEAVLLESGGFIYPRSRRSFLTAQINSMRVESALCDTSFRAVKKEFLDFCTHYGEFLDGDLEGLGGETYLALYQSLYKAILSDPMNGYAYNALFQVFEEEYEKCKAENNQEAMLKRLSEVRLIADDAASLDIQNRGGNSDELGRHIARIAEYSGEQNVSIEDVLHGDPEQPFAKLFRDMLAKNNASAICFVCQRELDEAGLGGTSLSGESFHISEYQKYVCKRIMEFMRREEYKDCVENDQHALYFLLRVSWMHYNGTLLEDGKEAKVTRLKKEAWRHVYNICESYSVCAKNKEGRGSRPIVELLRALAHIHLFDDYVVAARIMMDLEQFSIFLYRRMRVPYLICDEYGKPKNYTGKVTVLDTDNQFNGYIQFDGVPIRRGIRFTKKNLGMRVRPRENEILTQLELGLGYAGFSAYKKEGREGELEK